MNNWETEYEVKYHITSKQDDGKQKVKNRMLFFGYIRPIVQQRI